MVVPDAVEEDTPDVLIVNTCGFMRCPQRIHRFLLEALQAKEEGRLGKVLVMGCLSGRYREELRIPCRRQTAFTVSTTYRLYAHSWAWPMTQSQRRVLSRRPVCVPEIGEGCDRRCSIAPYRSYAAATFLCLKGIACRGQLSGRTRCERVEPGGAGYGFYGLTLRASGNWSG